MPFPNSSDLSVNCRRLLGCLNSQRIAVIVASIGGWRSKMNHSMVAANLVLKIRADRSKEVLDVAGPIGRSVDRPAITQYDRGVTNVRNVLKLPLYIEDSPL